MANDENNKNLRSNDSNTNTSNDETVTSQTLPRMNPFQLAVNTDTSDNNDQKPSTTELGHISICDSTNVIGKSEDPVDLCQISNGESLSSSNQTQNQRKQTTFGYGDYKNIRATGSYNADSSSDLLQNQPPLLNHVPPPQNTFSFKHFLSRDSSTSSGTPSSSAAIITSITTNVANSTTAATADSPQCAQQHKIEATTAGGSDSTITPSVLTTAAPSTSTCSSSCYQSSTGARPKVPQSTSSSVSSTSISSLSGNSKGYGGNNSGAAGADSPCSSSKMKRSPRFSSFDSQASLAEYTETAPVILENSNIVTGSCNNVLNSGFRLHPESSDLTLTPDREDIFARAENRTLGSKSSTASSSHASDYDRYFVPRSYSNYDMQVPPSPRRRVGVITSNSDVRPNRLSGIQPQGVKVKGNLLSTGANTMASSSRDQPLDTYFLGDHPSKLPSASSGSGASTSNSNSSRLVSNPEFGGTPAATSALPDFVQDHLMDSWYPNDMNLTSPPNSPTGFVEDLPAGCGGAGSSGNSGTANVSHSSISGEKCQTLPDFLSDGPIIHSSQRLADVAAGLPSNLDSPDDNSPSLQISRLRLENERLCRELNESRIALGEQIRQCNELERTLEQTHKMESAYNRTLAQNIGLVEENLDQSKKRNAAATYQISKLKQQVKQLTGEVEILKRENDILREEGAVGGSSGSASGGLGLGARDRGPNISSSRPSAASTNTKRPSRAQQLSKDLLKAASNAENNLRQLLAGVDNLRQMAADIDNAERTDYDDSPDLFSEFLDDCDDYDEYTGGPAL